MQVRGNWEAFGRYQQRGKGQLRARMNLQASGGV